MQLVEGENILNVQMVRIISSLYGVVTESGSGLPMMDVLVQIDGLSTTTNSSGQYGFDDMEPGTYVVVFSKAGYHDETR